MNVYTFSISLPDHIIVCDDKCGHAKGSCVGNVLRNISEELVFFTWLLQYNCTHLFVKRIVLQLKLAFEPEKEIS